MSELYDYGEFCPISMATTTLCERWTLQIIREMVLGATRFSHFQKHLPRISPTLLKNRLRFLEEQNILIRRKIQGQKGYEYQLTPKGRAVEPILNELGRWGMTWVHEGLTDEELNAHTLMRDLSAAIDLEALPAGSAVIQLTFKDLDLPPQFIQITDGCSQSCDQDMGFDVDLYLTASLLTFNQIWYGDVLLQQAIDKGDLVVVGNPAYARSMPKWLRISGYADLNPNYQRATGRIPLKDQQEKAADAS